MASMLETQKDFKLICKSLGEHNLLKLQLEQSNKVDASTKRTVRVT